MFCICNGEVSGRPAFSPIRWIDSLAEVLVSTSGDISPGFRDYQFPGLCLIPASTSGNREAIEQPELILGFDL